MTDQEIIDRIRQIRAKNNDPWMRIVMIALKHSRDETRTVLSEILHNDLDVCSEVERLLR